MIDRLILGLGLGSSGQHIARSGERGFPGIPPGIPGRSGALSDTTCTYIGPQQVCHQFTTLHGRCNKHSSKPYRRLLTQWQCYGKYIETVLNVQ